MKRTLQSKVVIAELQRIAAKSPTGTALPKDVVDAARPKKSVLHRYFTWEDSEAAEQWRQHQARNLLRVVAYVVEGEDDTDMLVKAFVSLTTDRKAGLGYRTMVSVMSNAGAREQLLADALAELSVFRVKYAQLTELAAVFDAIDKTKQRRQRRTTHYHSPRVATKQVL